MKRIAFLSFDWDYQIVSEYYLGLQDRLRDRTDLQVVIFSAFGHYYASHKPEASTFEVFRLCRIEEYDGLLIQGNRTWPPELRQQLVDRAVALGKPVVSINYDLKGAHCVGTNNYQEEYELVSRVLQDRGCTHPAFVNGLRTSAEAAARAQAYRDACADQGITDVRFFQANWQTEAGVVTAKKMLRRPGNLPDVIFCCNDDLAFGVQTTLQEAGVRVPEDVMITGFDNREISRQATPRITTIDRDYRTIAATALDAIERLMAGEELPQQVFSPAKHLMSASCGYPGESDERQMDALVEANRSFKRFYEVLGTYQYAVTGCDSLYTILENCELFTHELDCDNAFLSLNDSYLRFGEGEGKDVGVYGPTSHLMVRKDRSPSSTCDREHIYASYPSERLLPPEIPLSRPIYLVCPLRHNDMCVGMVVTEGVPSVIHYGFLAFFLTMLSASIEAARKSRLLRTAAS